MWITRFLLAAGLCATAACAQKKEETVQIDQKPASVASTPAPVGDTVRLVEADDGLLEGAKISDQAARATALDSLKGGRIMSAEIEKENGALIYTYDVQMPGRTGIEEANVDAVSGRIIAIQHEGPSAEAAEAKQEGAPPK